jgi:uncharacterized repeat protein (TIGR03847 family)
VNSQRLDLGRVDDVHVESFGQPGERTFRIRIQKAGGSVSLWIEKYQVVLLGNAIGELLGRTTEARDPQFDDGVGFLGELEVHVGALTIAYDGERAVFVVEASEFESAFDLQTITFQADRAQFDAMNGEIGSIVAGSRPRCVLCGTPLTGEPHFCPQQNGHAKTRMEESE